MNNYLKLTLALLSINTLSPSIANASSCKASTLKKHGNIKERSDGYVEALKTDEKTTQCIKHINNKRRDKYQAIADKEKVSLADVEASAAEEIQKKDSAKHKKK